MNRRLSFAAIAVATVLASAAPAAAAVNCGIVNRDLENGRQPEDIAERMGIKVAEVHECKAKGSQATTGAVPSSAPVNPQNNPKGVSPTGVRGSDAPR